MTAPDSLLKISFCRSVVKSQPCTVLGLTLLLTVGLLGIVINPSSRQDDGIDDSLDRISDAFSLIQAFHGDSSRPAPKLWNQRLGLDRASELWKRQGRSIWWQGWSEDGDAYLILPDGLLRSDTQQLRSHPVLSLVIIGSDELHRQQFIQRLKRQPEAPAEPHSLQQRCMQHLTKGPGVVWTGDALASISGTTAPLLQQASHGCLALRLKGNQLHWGGFVGDRSISLAAEQPENGWNFSASVRQQTVPFSASSLLEVHGARLNLILGTLFSRQVIQEPLEKFYGVNQSIRSRLASSPFSLRLQLQSKGAYRAGIQFQAPLPGGFPQWKSVLDKVSSRLEERGFQSQPLGEKSQPDNALIWTESRDGQARVVGGWRWLQRSNQPSLFSAGLASLPEIKPFYQARRQSDPSVLLLKARPLELNRVGLMDGSWPPLLKQADSVHIQIKPALSQSGTKAAGVQQWWEISGHLVLSSAAEVSDNSD